MTDRDTQTLLAMGRKLRAAEIEAHGVGVRLTETDLTETDARREIADWALTHPEAFRPDPWNLDHPVDCACGRPWCRLQTELAKL